MKINRIHKNKYYWGITELIIANDGDGVVTVEYRYDRTDACISNLSVYYSARNKGLATELMNKAEELAREKKKTAIQLFIEENDTVQYLYEKLGYKVIPNEYENGYILMEKPLNYELMIKFNY